MRISDLHSFKIGILGFGREGQALYDVLRQSEYKDVIHVFSDHPLSNADGFEIDQHVGMDAANFLPNIELLIRSPGFSPNHSIRQAADDLSLHQTTSTNLFLNELRHEQLPVIGVTGSKGKSTTSTLAHLMLQEARVPSVLVGNIGKPALNYLDKIIRDKAVTIMELSSYQCSDLDDAGGVSIACLLDMFPEHLDWHGDVESYFRAKTRVALTQRVEDIFYCSPKSASYFLDTELKSSMRIINTKEGLHFSSNWFYCGNKRLFNDSKMILKGVHNRKNAIAAFSLVESFGVNVNHMQVVLSQFKGLPYRLEYEGVHHGIRWINDSLSTAPEAVIAALQSDKEVIHTLIVGGQDRGYDMKLLAEEIANSNVCFLILLPNTGTILAHYMQSISSNVKLFEVDALDEAVILAKKVTTTGATCLFSPGAPSYNNYVSFEERGAHFKALISSDPVD